MHTCHRTVVHPIRSISEFALLTLVCLVFTTNAQTNLSGDIGTMTLTADGNPYIVSGELLVPANRSTIIEAGCQFFFKFSAGLKVNGSLTAQGTEKRPILFTSIHDSLSPEKDTLPPNPFDWNGIIVASDAGNVTMSHFHLRYSAYGLKSQINTLLVNQGVFRNNGQFNFTINETIQQVVDGVPFTFATHTLSFQADSATSGNVPVGPQRYNAGAVVNLPSNSGSLVKPGHTFAGWNTAADGSGKDYAVGSVFEMGDTDVELYAQWHKVEKAATPAPSAPKQSLTALLFTREFMMKKGMPISIGVAGIASGGVAIWSLAKWFDKKERYESTTDEDRIEDYKDDGRRYSTYAICSGTVSVAALSTAVFLYFRKNPPKKRMALLPVIAPGTKGATIVLNLPMKTTGAK